MKIATNLGVPRSTAAGWLRRTELTIVSAEPLSICEKQLQAEVVRLRRRIQGFRAAVRIFVALLRVFGIELDWKRLPDGEMKSGLLRAIDRAVTTLELRRVLRILGLSASRYHAWRRSELRSELAVQGNQTPDEMYFGTGGAVPERLGEEKAIAQQSRTRC